MGIGTFYRQIPNYFATAVARLSSVVRALIIAVFGAAQLDFLLDHFPGRSGDLGNATIPVFYLAPSLVLVALVACFSAFVSFDHRTSWRTPTLAWALGAVFLRLWVGDFSKTRFQLFLPGVLACLVCGWLLRKKSMSLSYVP